MLTCRILKVPVYFTGKEGFVQGMRQAIASPDHAKLGAVWPRGLHCTQGVMLGVGLRAV
jgi:hypothetical protein